MSWNLLLLEGAAAVTRLRAEAASGTWQRLATCDPRPTWFQEPAFVLAWYAAYAGVVDPLVVVGRRDDRLVGLLALARRPGGEIIHAGANHAWYDGWIAEPELDREFIVAATDAVLQRHRPASWRWKFLPRGFDAGWTDALRSGGALVSEHGAPVWDVTEPDAIERHLKPRLRNYINRYRRAGHLELARVRDQDALRALHVVAPWCDLRHGAVHADLPFRDDPRKMPLHELLAGVGEPVHTSVLRFDDRPLAVHMGAWDGNCLTIGLYGFDPTESKQSPGNILMLELAAAVRQLGGREIDLTAGGESWKDGFASRQDPVFRVELSASAARHGALRIARATVAAAKKLLGTAGIGAEDVRRLAEPLFGGGDPPAPAPVHLYEIEVHSTASPGDTPAVTHAVDAGWLRHLLEVDGAGDRAHTAATLTLATRLLHRGWQPQVQETRPAPSTMLWIPPADCAVIVPDATGPEPVAAIRPGAPEPAGLRVPDGVHLRLVGHDSGDPEALAELLVATATAGSQRVWIAATALTATTERWLRDHARPVSRTSAAARASAAA